MFVYAYILPIYIYIIMYTFLKVVSSKCSKKTDLDLSIRTREQSAQTHPDSSWNESRLQESRPLCSLQPITALSLRILPFTFEQLYC